ncbi:MAG: hypothetical protein ACREX0_06760, partial [Noviherbaspirillum sp.]
MDTNQATRNDLQGKTAEDDELDSGLAAPPASSASRAGGVDLKAIREAIARVEAEAKATVAAENRAHAEARARALSEDRARVDAAA